MKVLIQKLQVYDTLRKETHQSGCSCEVAGRFCVVPLSLMFKAAGVLNDEEEDGPVVTVPHRGAQSAMPWWAPRNTWGTCCHFYDCEKVPQDV